MKTIPVDKIDGTRPGRVRKKADRLHILMSTSLQREQFDVLLRTVRGGRRVVDDALWMYSDRRPTHRSSALAHVKEVYWTEIRGVLIDHKARLVDKLNLNAEVLHAAVQYMDAAIMRDVDRMRPIFTGCTETTSAVRERLVRVSTACVCLSAKMFGCEEVRPEKGYIQALAESSSDQKRIVIIERALFRAIEAIVGKPTMWTAIPYIERILGLKRCQHTDTVALLCAKHLPMQIYNPIQRALIVVRAANRAQEAHSTSTLDPKGARLNGFKRAPDDDAVAELHKIYVAINEP